MKRIIFFGIIAATLVGVGLYSLVVKVRDFFKKENTLDRSTGFYIGME
ncbi:hypothetical protein CE91St36_11350 [Christensenellaceae bacterium]|nr:hypothetical protein CE91St36_11350 [Christensenellaceae bacterium]BDF60986.1 hypothetical protein CE91St37_11360 [Christensenellaceae bacterium]